MNTGDNSSDLDGDSQATQLLEPILDSEHLSRKTSRIRRSVKDHSSVPKDMPDSTPSRDSNPSPHYHYHGLASTQTQPENQHIEVDHSSQKENISAKNVPVGEVRAIPPRTSTLSPQPSSAKDTAVNVPLIGQSTRSFSRVTKARATEDKAASLRSPYKKTGGLKNLTSMKSKTHPQSTTNPIHLTLSPQMSSQDSFVDEIYQDPEQRFLAASKQFDVPLSELERVVSSTGPARAPYKQSNSARQARWSLTPSEGEVLVESTPSVSSGSQSQPSQQVGELQQTFMNSNQPTNTDLPVDHVGNLSQHSTEEYASDATSSSYRRHLEDPYEDEASRVPDQATQPSTQIDNDNVGSSTYKQLSGVASATNGDSHGHGTSTSTNLPHSRNLLGLVDPKKMWRYQKYQYHGTGLPQVSMASANPSTGAVTDTTQPSFDEEMSNRSRRTFPDSTHPKYTDVEGGPSHLRARVDAVNDVAMLIPGRNNSNNGPSKVPPRNTSPRYDSRIPPKDVISDSTIIGDETKAMQPNTRQVGRLLFPEEEEEEEEVPLANKIPIRDRTTGRGKRKTTPDRSPRKKASTVTVQPKLTEHKEGKLLSVAQQTMSEPANITRDDRQTRKVAGIHQPREIGEVPSSVPDQDLAKPVGSRHLKRGTREGQLKSSGAKTQRHIPTRHRKRPPSSNKNTNNDQVSQSEDELPVQRIKEDQSEGRMETADYGHMEVDPQPRGLTSRKRTRAMMKENPKASTRDSQLVATSPTTRQAKRLRSAPRSAAKEPTRVVALWKQDGHYYPGIVHSHEGGSRYLIKFDDSTEGVVNIDQMRLCELRVGDDVLIPRFRRGTKVVNIANLKSNVVSVRVDEKIQEIPLGDIKIANKTIACAWKDRGLSPASISTVIKPGNPSPTPSRLSIASGPSLHGTRSNLLEKTAFAITITPGNEKERENLLVAIKNHGGSVIDDWTTVIRMEGKHTLANSRWVIHKSDVRWIGKDDIERIFLLADDASQKPKFLIALALGIPCLSIDWLHDSVKMEEEKDWLAYLLPQGYSEALGARASQQIDMDWGNTIHHLNDIMDNSVACKLFDKLSILCVGPEMVPHPKGKKLPVSDEKTQEAQNAVTRIILAMGAERVEAVCELKYASAPVSDFDFVIIKEAYQYDDKLEEGRTVHWTWVKDCLIASRQLPLPAWGLQDGESQDA